MVQITVRKGAGERSVGDEVAEGMDGGVDPCAKVARGEEGGPPAGLESVVAYGKEARGSDEEEKEYGAGPADAEFGGIVAEDAGTTDVGGEGGPTVVFFVGDGVCRAGSLEKALGPEVGIEAESRGIAADDAFGEDAAGKQTKLLLLKRAEMALADLGDGSNLFKRNAAGQPLSAQVFSEVSHRQPFRGQAY